MTPPTADQFAGRVAANARVSTFAAAIVGANGPYAVTDADGQVIGQIAGQAVIDLLAGREAAV
jgi:ABC-type proline/glycine betaine transport system ATPase subunit